MSSLIPQANQSLSGGGNDAPSDPPANATTHLPKLNFREIWNAILRRLWVVILFVIIGLVLALVYISGQPELYESHGSLLVKTRSAQVFIDNPLASEEATNLEQMITVEQGLLSATVLLRVAEKHDLANQPSYQTAADDQQRLLEIMRNRITVELRKGSRLIDVTVHDPNPVLAARMVEDIVAEYEEWKDTGRMELIAKASAGLASEEKRLRAEMEEAESRLKDFRDEHPVLGLSGRQERLLSSRLETLGSELSSATAERLRLEAQKRSLEEAPDTTQGLTGLAAEGERGQLAIELERRISEKRAEFVVLKQRYGPKWPTYIETQQELARLEENLAQVVNDAESALSSDLEMVESREEKLESMVATAKGEAMNDEELRQEFTNLTRDAEVSRDLHTQVVTRLQQTKVESALNSSFLRWDERPFPASHPTSPRKAAIAVAGIFLGGVLGVFLGLVLEILDPKVREASAVERKLRLPLLASLPTYTRNVVSDLSVSAGSGDHRGRPAHLARYALSSDGEPSRMETLLFASQFDGDGKSLCALKCARTMVKQGYRTLLIDADFRVPGLSRHYSEQRDGRHGLSAYLAEEAEAAEVLYETGLPGLWFLPTGEADKDDGDLLAGPAFRKLLQAVEPMFDRLIIDITSLRESDDVQAVTRHLGATYLVAQKGRGKYRDLKDAATTLQSAGANLVGFIWNEGATRRRRKDDGPVIEPMAYPVAEASLSEKARERAVS